MNKKVRKKRLYFSTSLTEKEEQNNRNPVGFVTLRLSTNLLLMVLVVTDVTFNRGSGEMRPR